MTDFKAKMHQIRLRLGLRPRPHWGSLQRSPDPLSDFGGWFAAREGLGWGRGGKGGREGEGGGVEGREREGPKLLLNQGPSEPCYTTVNKFSVIFSSRVTKVSPASRSRADMLIYFGRRAS